MIVIAVRSLITWVFGVSKRRLMWTTSSLGMTTDPRICGRCANGTTSVSHPLREMRLRNGSAKDIPGKLIPA